MSNQAQIDRLTKAKADIKAAIESKGVAVPGGALLDQYAPLINQIQQGTQIPAETLAIVKIFTANDTFTVPQTGNYKITVIGKGGDGGKAGYYSSSYCSGCGGGAGGAAQSLLSLAKGEGYAITVDTSQSSFGSFLSAVKGGDGATRNVGTGGTSSGGNVFAISGGSGKYGGDTSTAQASLDGGDGGYYANASSYDEKFLYGSAPETKGVKPLSGLAPYKPTNHGFPPFGVGGGGGSRFYDSPYNAFLGGGPGGFGAVIVELVLK